MSVSIYVCMHVNYQKEKHTLVLFQYLSIYSRNTRTYSGYEKRNKHKEYIYHGLITKQ